MIYQDSWVNGQCIQKGYRDCAGRYEIVKEACGSLPKWFSVLDIGANMCYFSLRLIEDFDCNAMAFEFNSFEKREKIVKANKTNKLIFLKRKITIPDLLTMSTFCHFDLVLAMSVLHHLPGDTQEWLSAFGKIGSFTIAEFALDDSTRPTVRKNYRIPDHAKILGYGDSHLKKDFKRPIVLCKNHQ